LQLNPQDIEYMGMLVRHSMSLAREKQKGKDFSPFLR